MANIDACEHGWPGSGCKECKEQVAAAAFERQRTDVDERVEQAPTAHEELPGEPIMVNAPVPDARQNPDKDPDVLARECLAKRIIAALEAEQKRLDDEDYIMDTRDCINVIREQFAQHQADDVTMAMADAFGGGNADEAGESTSAQVASTAARLLGMSNIMMRGSPYYGAILKAVKDNGFVADGKMLDAIEAIALVIEPFMRDVRSVAGSALTQLEPVVADPEPIERFEVTPHPRNGV